MRGCGSLRMGLEEDLVREWVMRYSCQSNEESDVVMKAIPSLAIPDCGLCPNRECSDICEILPQTGESLGLVRRQAVYQPGQHVFYEGHVALGLYILCQGCVKLTRLNRKGQQRLVGILNGGQLLEKQAFQEQPVHQVTCEVLESSQISLVDQRYFLNFLKDHGEAAVKLIQVLSKEMTEVVNTADQFAFTPARERLARLLVDLSERFGEPVEKGRRITLQLKREDLAQMAAVTLETVVRLLRNFQESELIAVQGRNLTLLNVDRLAALATASSSM